MSKLAIAFLFLFLVIACHAEIITVDNDGPADFNNIQAAINDANNGDIILIQIGTYQGDGNRDIDFFGKAITVQSVDPCDPAIVAATILNCQATKTVGHRGFNFIRGEGANSVLAGLKITGGFMTDGGGIYCDGSPTIRYCILQNNHAKNYGGGIRINSGSPDIFSCTFTNNYSNDGYYKEGAAIHSSGSPTIRCCLIANNQASNYGGGIVISAGNPLIDRCIIKANSAYVGGGIYRNGGNPTISNCMITNNSVGFNGGGLFCSGSATIRNCTITSNSCSSRAAGIYCTTNTVIGNCIIWGNFGLAITGSGFVVTYSDIEGDAAGTGNVNVDPLFVAPSSGNYHLSSNSLCIDAGDPGYDPPQYELDIDNNARKINGRVDIGADEFDYEGPILSVYPNGFSFSSYTKDPNPQLQYMHIQNTGSGVVNWEITGNSLWLSVCPSSGVSNGDVNEVTLTVDTSNLDPGSYNCELTITAEGCLNSPLTVPIILNVFAPAIHVTPQMISFTCIQGQREPNSNILNINNSGTG